MAQTKKSVLPETWVTYLTPFAEAIGVSVEDASQALTTVVGEPSDAAMTLLKDAHDGATFEEIKGCFANAPSAQLRAAVNTHLREAKVVEAPEAPSMTLDVLPTPRPDESFIAALKVGGVSKVGVTDIEAGVKAALAERVQFFDIPKKVLAQMKQHAEVTEEPFGEQYYDVVKMITKRDYAEIFNALGVPASAVPQTERSKFLQQIERILWPSIQGFHGQLSGWFDTWMAAAGNPAVMMQAFTSMAGGGQMMAPAITVPDTETLRIAADEVVDNINRAYAGVGIPAARALAYEATQIKELLQKPEIMGLVGATTRELMLKQLGIDVSANFVSMEHSLVKYVLSVAKLTEQPKGSQQEQFYLQGLYQLGAAIAWDKLITDGTQRRRTRRTRPEENSRDDEPGDFFQNR